MTLCLVCRQAGISFEISRPGPDDISRLCAYKVSPTEVYEFSLAEIYEISIAGISEISQPENLVIPPAENFSARQRGRLRCRCCGLEGMDAEFLHALARLQELYGPLNISSGRRCARHNLEVGGVQNSRHLRGQAADIFVPAGDQPQFCALARAVGIRRILPEPKRGYVHLSL